MDSKQIADELKDYLVKTFAIEEDEDFSYDVNLFDYGYVDSLDAVKIVAFLEEHWNIEITQKDIVLYPMNSIHEIAEVVAGKIN